LTATLTIRPVDARRRRLPVEYRITVERSGSTLQTAVFQPGIAEARFPELLLQQVYTVMVVPDRFKVTGRIVAIQTSDRSEMLLCLLHPRHAEIQFPDFSLLDSSVQLVLERSTALDAPRLQTRSTAVRQTESRALGDRVAGSGRPMPGRNTRDVRSGRVRWERLGPEQRAGLLNLFAKMRSITLAEGATTGWSYVDTLEQVERDRIHALVQPSLFDQVKRTPCFAEASGLLHGSMEGFRRVMSFKTREPFGNLQLTFFAREGDTLPTLVDADVDDAAGIEHADQVLRNESQKFVRKLLGGIFPGLPEGKTHPYDIHQILIFHQGHQQEPFAHISRYEPCYLLLPRDTPVRQAI
jgi:hypothetical protein